MNGCSSNFQIDLISNLQINSILNSPQVDFSPTTKKLADMMNVCAKDLTTCISIIPRLPEILSKKRGHKETMVRVNNSWLYHR